MTTTKDGALLAHISDTVTATEEVVVGQGEVQRNILTVLNAVLDTCEAQTEMLTELLGAASQEAGPSPVAEALEALVAVMERINENQAILIGHVAELPGAIGRQFEASLRELQKMTPETA